MGAAIYSKKRKTTLRRKPQARSRHRTAKRGHTRGRTRGGARPSRETIPFSYGGSRGGSSIKKSKSSPQSSTSANANAPEPALKPAPEPALKPAPEPALKPAPEPAPESAASAETSTSDKTPITPISISPADTTALSKDNDANGEIKNTKTGPSTTTPIVETSDINPTSPEQEKTDNEKTDNETPLPTSENDSLDDEINNTGPSSLSTTDVTETSDQVESDQVDNSSSPEQEKTDNSGDDRTDDEINNDNTHPSPIGDDELVASKTSSDHEELSLLDSSKNTDVEINNVDVPSDTSLAQPIHGVIVKREKGWPGNLTESAPVLPTSFETASDSPDPSAAFDTIIDVIADKILKKIKPRQNVSSTPLIETPYTALADTMQNINNNSNPQHGGRSRKHRRKPHHKTKKSYTFAFNSKTKKIRRVN